MLAGVAEAFGKRLITGLDFRLESELMSLFKGLLDFRECRFVAALLEEQVSQVAPGARRAGYFT